MGLRGWSSGISRDGPTAWMGSETTWCGSQEAVERARRKGCTKVESRHDKRDGSTMVSHAVTSAIAGRECDSRRVMVVTVVTMVIMIRGNSVGLPSDDKNGDKKHGRHTTSAYLG